MKLNIGMLNEKDCWCDGMSVVEGGPYARHQRDFVENLKLNWRTKEKESFAWVWWRERSTPGAETLRLGTEEGEQEPCLQMTHDRARDGLCRAAQNKAG